MLLSWYYRLPHAVRWQLAPLRSPWSVARLRRECRDPDGRFHPYLERRAIFVHVPKCAGTSVAQAVFGQEKFAHRSVSDYQLMFSPDEFASFLKFAVVRNPWDRLVSAWHFLRSDRCPAGDRRWAVEHLDHYADFADFVRNGLHKPAVQQRHHFRKQVSYLRLPGSDELLVDRICRVENLQADMGAVFKALGVPAAPVERLNPSAHRDYRSYYDNDSRAIVAEHYLDDIVALGYRFEASTIA